MRYTRMPLYSVATPLRRAIALASAMARRSGVATEYSGMRVYRTANPQQALQQGAGGKVGHRGSASPENPAARGPASLPAPRVRAFLYNHSIHCRLLDLLDGANEGAAAEDTCQTEESEEGGRVCKTNE